MNRIVSASLAAALVSGATVYAVVAPSAEERAHNVRTHDIARKHENCLQEISDRSTSADSIPEARRKLRDITSRAHDCYSGSW